MRRHDGARTLWQADGVDGGVQERALRRFDALRANALRLLDEGAGVPGAGDAPASGWCLSSVARLVTLAPDGGAASALDAVADLQRQLDAVGAWRHYPPDALHVSLLGCTQREPERPDDPARWARVVDCVRAAWTTPVTVRLGRLNLVGAQAFVEVVPLSREWADARVRLATALSAAGEDPMSHPDPEPLHLNVSRLQRLDDAARLRALLDDPRAGVEATVEVHTVEVVLTDFVLSPDATTVVATVPVPGRAT